MSPEVEAMHAAVAEMKATVEGLKTHIESLHGKQMRYLVRMNETMTATLESYHKRISALEPPDEPNGSNGGGGFRVMDGG